MSPFSAGILLYRSVGAQVEVLIAHPGGPFFARKDEGAWSIPKGLVDADEPLERTARREWEEETGMSLPGGPWLDLGSTQLKSGKTVRAWAVNGDVDPAHLVANTFEIEWPPHSGRMQTFPEIDRLQWADVETAARLLNPAQVVLVERLLKMVADSADE
jgi:predicted NUDIX family NTP pyrophosphohydrolase